MYVGRSEKIEIQLFLFLLTELSSPMRSREQVNSGGQPSTSGRKSTIKVRQYGTIWANRRVNLAEFRGAPVKSGLRHDQNYRDIHEVHGLFYKENDHLLPVENNFATAMRDGYLFGIIIDGYIRPIYNQIGQTILLRKSDRKEFLISLKEVEARFGANKRLPEEYFDSNKHPTA